MLTYRVRTGQKQHQTSEDVAERLLRSDTHDDPGDGTTHEQPAERHSQHPQHREQDDQVAEEDDQQPHRRAGRHAAARPYDPCHLVGGAAHGQHAEDDERDRDPDVDQLDVQLAAVQPVAVGTSERQRDDGTDAGHQSPPEIGVYGRIEPLRRPDGGLLVHRHRVQQLPTSPS